MASTFNLTFLTKINNFIINIKHKFKSNHERVIQKSIEEIEKEINWYKFKLKNESNPYINEEIFSLIKKKYRV